MFTVPFYVASRASLPERGKMWRNLRLRGLNITSSWIDEDGEGQTQSFEDLWLRIEAEVRSAVALALYVEPGDFPLKGALVEVGMALAFGKPVLVFAPGVELNPRDCKPLGSWVKHPGVMLMRSGVETLLTMESLMEGRDPSEPISGDALWTIRGGLRER
jgi:hypothetical protein